VECLSTGTLIRTSPTFKLLAWCGLAGNSLPHPQEQVRTDAGLRVLESSFWHRTRSTTSSATMVRLSTVRWKRISIPTILDHHGVSIRFVRLLFQSAGRLALGLQTTTRVGWENGRSINGRRGRTWHTSSRLQSCPDVSWLTKFFQKFAAVLRWHCLVSAVLSSPPQKTSWETLANSAQTKTRQGTLWRTVIWSEGWPNFP